MSQPCTSTQTQTGLLSTLQQENVELRQYLAAQKVVIAALERRAGRSLETLGIHVNQLMNAGQNSPIWHQHLDSIQNEVNCLSDLVSDTMLLQKLEAGKIEVKLEPLDLRSMLVTVSRHLLEPKDGSAARLVCEIASPLPIAWADQDLTEAVLIDLLARSLKYSDPTSPVVLEVKLVDDRIQLCVTAERFAPIGNRDFATEIVLCCRRIEVQGGTVTCQQQANGLQTVTATLQIAN
jgi:signal transduction histidine kinase